MTEARNIAGDEVTLPSSWARVDLPWSPLALARETPWGQSPDWDAIKSAVQDLHDASREQCQSVRSGARCSLNAGHDEYHSAGLQRWSTPHLAALHAVRDAYGGDPSDPVWDTPEGIAGIIEGLSALVRVDAAKLALATFAANHDQSCSIWTLADNDWTPQGCDCGASRTEAGL